MLPKARRSNHTLSLSNSKTGNIFSSFLLIPVVFFSKYFKPRSRTTTSSPLKQISLCKILSFCYNNVDNTMSLTFDHETSTGSSSLHPSSQSKESDKSTFIHSCREVVYFLYFNSILSMHLSSSRSLWKDWMSSSMFSTVVCLFSQHFQEHHNPPLPSISGNEFLEQNSVTTSLCHSSQRIKFSASSTMHLFMTRLLLITCCCSFVVSTEAKDLIIRERISGDQELLAFLIGFILFLSILVIASFVSRCVWSRDQRNNRSAQRLLTHHGDPNIYPVTSSSRSRGFLSSLLQGIDHDTDCDTEDDDDDEERTLVQNEQQNERQPLSSSYSLFQQQSRHSQVEKHLHFSSSSWSPRSTISSSSSNGASFSQDSGSSSGLRSLESRSSSSSRHVNDDERQEQHDASLPSSCHQLHRSMRHQKQLLPDISEDTSFYNTKKNPSSSASSSGNYDERVSKTCSLPSSFTYTDSKDRGMRLMTNFDDVYDASEEENAMEGGSWSSRSRSKNSPRFKRLCVRIKNHRQYKKKQNVSFL